MSNTFTNASVHTSTHFDSGALQQFNVVLPQSEISPDGAETTTAQEPLNNDEAIASIVNDGNNIFSP